jgi:hypothetical protein
MPVKLKKGKVVLSCDVEGCKEQLVLTRQRGAAPELTACEEAQRDYGWGYSIGFFAMLVGHRVICLKCKKG